MIKDLTQNYSPLTLEDWLDHEKLTLVLRGFPGEYTTELWCNNFQVRCSTFADEHYTPVQSFRSSKTKPDAINYAKIYLAGRWMQKFSHYTKKRFLFFTWEEAVWEDFEAPRFNISTLERDGNEKEN